ncbi:hypothetical protein OG946_08545 [Streptomyces sp. NBC_01808]|uniref:hypothetical protein n=1 Tax=Streptomyces sp. NBC_01808 TaxID=2975947 RepID=UPI002DDAABAA|nr:hypothetical protein [Streptomyces sp. NBC_01808]WSA37421.1 hypothetical protein OG946_08545 [Streptomyces sp. NBC_01808]
MRARLTVLTTVAALALGLLAPTALAGPAAGSPRSVRAEQPRGGDRAGCDPIGPAECLLPFPNDWYTEQDRRTDTGRRIAFEPSAMPANAAGTRIDPAEWNRSDGFSPGSMILAHVPGVDLGETRAAPLTDIGASLDRDAPIVLLDADTGKRHPYWAELDANATGPARQALVVRPARNLAEGHRYVVALRRLKDAEGRTLPAPDAFRRVDGPALRKGDPLYERQRDHRQVRRDLARAGVTSRGLYLAWDFTVAGERSLSERMLHIRDDAFAGLGKGVPEHLVYEVKDHPADDPVARTVRGVYNVPSYLDAPGGPPGSGFHRAGGGKDALPARLPGNNQVVPFQCEIPRAALGGPGERGRAARPVLYGHGLLGNETQVGSRTQRELAVRGNFVMCATKWQGMADEDIPFVASTLQDLSRFPAVADRLQQGVLNTLWLGRLMRHADGLAADGAFRGAGGASAIDVRARLGYAGHSQGGIMGGIYTAVAQDSTRSVLGVPGMNYSTLLNRSVDFAPFQQILDQAYPDKLRQQLGFALMQMVWDRGEANGYARHMTSDPLPRTPRHQVLMHVAYGDHQVSPTAAEVQARTVGARIHAPAVADGRSPDEEPYWGLRHLRYPYTGSGMLVWDSGSPYQPLTNTPPSEGRDPHSDPRDEPAAQRQMAEFLNTGRIVDVCGDAPCTAAPAG